jgi:carbon-monoxide dehydrogenase medium subunit
LDYRVTARKPDELAIEVKMPPLPVGTRTAFSALTRTSLDLAKVNAAVRLDMSQEKCLRARLALGAVAPTPLRLKKTEQLLEGVAITDSLLKAVEESVSTEISPIDDVRSTAAYRREVAGVLVRRTIKEACNGLKTH